MNVIAIDPGPVHSAYCLWDGHKILSSAILTNQEMLFQINEDPSFGAMMFIEEIAGYGMRVGKEVFRTCFAYGRFAEAYFSGVNREAVLVERRTVKLHLCHTARSTDADVRSSLIERFGTPGTKKNPGALYPAKSHVWAALALAVYAWDTNYVVES